MRNVKLYVYTL